MKWSDQLLRKMLALTHKPVERMDMVKFACAIMTGFHDLQLPPDLFADLIDTRMKIQRAFERYLEDGNKKNWNDTMVGIKQSLIEIGQEMEERNEA